MEFYRVEYMIENYEEFIKKENEQYKKQEKDQEKQYSNHQPGTGQFKVPNMTPPKFDIPKF